MLGMRKVAYVCLPERKSHRLEAFFKKGHMMKFHAGAVQVKSQ